MRWNANRPWLPWVCIGLLAVLCAFLAVLQYRWTGQIAAAERASLREDLQQRLMAASRDFNDRISSALREIVSSSGDPETSFAVWSGAHPHYFSSVRLEQEPGERQMDAIDIPLMNGEQWIRVQLDVNYLRTTLLPEIVQAHLAVSGSLDYDVEVVTEDRSPELIYRSSANAAGWDSADASASLLDLRVGGGRGGRHGPPRGFDGPPPGFRSPGGRPGGPPPMGPERWRMLARHKAGSLEMLVASTQTRNLTVSGAVLLLIVVTVAMLMLYSRKTQRLAELQMNFVTGVSHELRTPLTVIRTAAFNLRNPEFRSSEQKLERYSRMIEKEAGKLEGLVSQVMRFASAGAGHAIRGRAPVSINDVIDEETAAIEAAAESRGVMVEKNIDPNLAPVSGDREALGQAIRNLLDNALKHGTGTIPWIGVYGHAVRMGEKMLLEITISDKGSGIPAEEQADIFAPFVRGRKAVRDQVHGTGLGLNLVKSIVEAHGGSISVTSDHAGTRFILRIPA
jgi:signal transduction histidine kinase